MSLWRRYKLWYINQYNKRKLAWEEPLTEEEIDWGLKNLPSLLKGIKWGRAILLFSPVWIPLFLFIYGEIYYCVQLLTPEPPPVERKSPWINNDPTRPARETATYDYNTRMVTYHEPNPPEVIEKAHQRIKSQQSIRVASGDGITINIGDRTIHLSTEEILSQMSFDYDDVKDYLGDELQ